MSRIFCFIFHLSEVQILMGSLLYLSALSLLYDQTVKYIFFSSFRGTDINGQFAIPKTRHTSFTIFLPARSNLLGGDLRHICPRFLCLDGDVGGEST